MKQVRLEKVKVEEYELVIELLSQNNNYNFVSKLIHNGEVVEENKTYAITDDLKLADHIFDELIQNEVFPAHLHNIIDQIIA